MTDDDPLLGRSDLPGQEIPEDLELLIRTAVGWMHRRMRTTAPRDGLSYAAVSLLNRLRVAGPQSLSALAAWDGSTEPVIGQLTARLIDGGLVERDASAGDGPPRLRVTPRGTEAAQVWIDGSLAWLRDALDRLPDEERECLRRASDILVGVARS